MSQTDESDKGSISSIQMNLGDGEVYGGRIATPMRLLAASAGSESAQMMIAQNSSDSTVAYALTERNVQNRKNSLNN